MKQLKKKKDEKEEIIYIVPSKFVNYALTQIIQ